MPDRKSVSNYHVKHTAKSVFLALFLFANLVSAKPEVEELIHRPPGAFYESVAMDSKGALYLNERQTHTVFRVRAYGLIEDWAHAPVGGAFAGLAIDARDRVFATGITDQGVQAIFLFDPEGEASILAEIPQARFLNGATFLPDGRLLAVDSKLGAIDGTETGEIYAIDPETAEVELYFKDPLLGKANRENRAYPAVNGIKYFEHRLFLTNSERAQVTSLALNEDLSPKELTVIANGVVGDDFAVAEDGSLYITTHPVNSLVRLSPDGKVVTVADKTDGMVGATAAIFGRTLGDESSLYVVTNGGSYIPPESGVETAKVLRVRVQERGYQAFPGPLPTRPSWQLFVVTADTVADKAHLRRELGPKYAHYLEKHYRAIMIAGQVFEHVGGEPTTRLYLLEAPNAEAAVSFLEASPYGEAGMYENISARPFRSMIGRWMQGVAW